MGNQLMTRGKLEGITAAFATVINALNAQVETLSTQGNNNTNNNGNNQNDWSEGPIRVPRGGNNWIIENSSSEEEENKAGEGDERVNHHDYRVKVDIPFSCGTMGVEEFLDWQINIDRFFRRHGHT